MFQACAQVSTEPPSWENCVFFLDFVYFYFHQNKFYLSEIWGITLAVVTVWSSCKGHTSMSVRLKVHMKSIYPGHIWWTVFTSLTENISITTPPSSTHMLRIWSLSPCLQGLQPWSLVVKEFKKYVFIICHIRAIYCLAIYSVAQKVLALPAESQWRLQDMYFRTGLYKDTSVYPEPESDSCFASKQ